MSLVSSYEHKAENTAEKVIYSGNLVLITLLFRFRNESNGIVVLGVVFFLQTNFDFLYSHF